MSHHRPMSPAQRRAARATMARAEAQRAGDLLESLAYHGAQIPSANLERIKRCVRGYLRRERMRGRTDVRAARAF